MKDALGLVEIRGMSTAVVVADVMVKAANVRIIEMENSKGLGYMTIKIAGNVGAVTAAVDAGKQVGILHDKLVSAKVIPRPADGMAAVFCKEPEQKEKPKPQEKPKLQAKPAGKSKPAPKKKPEVKQEVKVEKAPEIKVEVKPEPEVKEEAKSVITPEQMTLPVETKETASQNPEPVKETKEPPKTGRKKRGPKK